MVVCLCQLGYTGCKCQINMSGYGGNLKNCADGYFDFPTCDECGCNQQGTLNGIKNCDKITGVCPCKLGFTGSKCTECTDGYYGFVRCKKRGTGTKNCDKITGDCACKLGYTGDKCRVCKDGYFENEFPTCNECGCDQRGTLNGNKNCDKITRVPILFGNSIFYVLSSIMIYDQSRRLPTINRQRVHIVVSSPKLKRKKSQYLLSR